MFIAADRNYDYLLQPNPMEFRPFYRVFAGQVVTAYQGYTLREYKSVPEMLVIGQAIFGAVATETRSFDTRQATLTHLRRVIELGSNQIIDATLGIKMPLSASIKETPQGMVFNHVPQLFSFYKGKILVSFQGNYDFSSGLFRGQCDFDWPVEAFTPEIL